ncbi:iron-dicitrate transporter subunit FecD [Sporosarcina globispora]|uniref:Iron-dicitrate transporter subunit FecD n=1 Tax=Sporosarcina globispora TaxID=1459 RepID=A0A0M0GJ96_SPOGL|nr:iron chelate uptake ABC transporter family permease subunit [Sporosarcina globispora]KON89975.1 iron-dicitrate transporter subunit FecD [Sporosarcina globispora]
MRKIMIVIFSFLLMVIFFTISLSVGTVTISLPDLFSSVMQKDSQFSFIVMEYRLPRSVISILAGFGLAVAGVILQSLVRNPLASPDVIGVTKGAGFFAALVIFLFPDSPAYVLPAAALFGAFFAFILLLIISKRLTISPAAFTLVGIAVGAIFQAGIQYLIVKFPTDINMALLWMSGSLWGRGWNEVLSLLPWIMILLPISWSQYQKLNVFQLGDEYSKALGLDIIRQRFLLLLLSVSLAGVSVASVGSIGFIGLIAPHIARQLVGGRHQYIIPLAALIGANLMLIGDSIGRVIIIPREVPVGVMTAIIGAPYFVYLLRKERKRN